MAFVSPNSPIHQDILGLKLCVERLRDTLWLENWRKLNVWNFWGGPYICLHSF